MNLANDVLDSAWTAILDNLPQSIGVAIAAILMGLGGWVVRRISTSQHGGVKGKDNAVVAPQDRLHQDDPLTAYISDLMRRGSTLSFGDPHLGPQSAATALEW